MFEARAVGILDDATFAAFVHSVLADPRYSSATMDLFDALAVTKVGLTGSGLRSMAELIKGAPTATRRVAIVAPPGAVFGMARMYELLRADIPVSVFHDRAEALAWLRQGEGAAAKAPPHP